MRVFYVLLLAGIRGFSDSKTSLGRCSRVRHHLTYWKPSRQG